jgi:magnesium transporter
MELGRHLARTMLTVHPVESSRILEALNPVEAAGELITLKPDRAAAVFRNMMRAPGAEVLSATPPEKGGPIVAALPVDVGGHILRLMKPAARDALLAVLPEQVADTLRPFLSFTEGTAGIFMNPDILVLPWDLSVRDALRRIPQISAGVQDPICIVDDNQILIGVVPLISLIAASSELRVDSLQRPVEHTLPASASLQTILAHPGWLDEASIPVVDERGAVLGMLDSRRLRRLEEETRMSADGDETAVALGELFRAGFNALLNSVLATSRPAAPPARGEKP